MKDYSIGLIQKLKDKGATDEQVIDALALSYNKAFEMIRILFEAHLSSVPMDKENIIKLLEK